MNIEIVTYWNIETLYYVFNAVASIVQSGTFTNMIRFVFLSALMVGIFSYGAAGKTLELATWFLQALLLTTLLNLPITSVLLTDKTGQEPPRTVGNVPVALAIVAQGSTMVFSRLTDFFETTFSVPGELGLAHGDVGFGHRILKQVNHVAIRDPGLRSDLMQFIKECTLYDLKDGSISSSDLIGNASSIGYSPWFVMFSNTNPARFSTYNTLPGATGTPPVTAPCPDVGAALALRVGDGIAAAQAFYGRTLFPRAATDAVAQGLFVGAVATSYDWILNNSQNASDAMKQSMFNNLWKDAGTELPTLLGDTSRVAEVSALMGSAQAAGQANVSNSVLSQLAQENLPHMRNWIEAILYALFPVVLLLAICMTAQGAMRLLGGYVMGLVWIGLWPLLFAIINGLSLLHLKHKTAALNLANNVPFQLTDVFDVTLGDEQAAIGYMIVLVPFIAGAIVKMGQGGMMSIADRMGASFTSAGASAGASAAMGNISAGQVGLDTASVNTTAMHKYDSNLSVIGGGASMSTARGGTLMMQGAHASRTDMLNRFANHLSVGRNTSAGTSQEAGQSTSIASGHAVSNQISTAATLSTVKRKGGSRSHVQAIDQSGAITQTGGVQGSASDTVRRHQDYNDNAVFGSAITSTTAFRVGGRVGAGTQAGGGSAKRNTSGASGGVNAGSGIDDQDEKRLLDTMTAQGASSAKKESALQNLRSSKGSRPSEPPGRGITGGLHLGLDNTQTATAHQGTGKSATTGVSKAADAGQGVYYNTAGTVSNAQSHGRLATQDEALSRESTRTQVDGYSETNDATLRSDSSVGQRANRSLSDSVAQHRDLLADPAFLAQVAQRNHMSEARFYNQDDVDLMRMVERYADERGMFQQATSLPRQSAAGVPLATSAGALQAAHAFESGSVSNRTAAAGVRHDRSVGISGQVTAPLANTVALPLATATDARTNVDKGVATGAAAAAPFVKNVQVWTNEGNPLGTGPVSTQTVTDQAVKSAAKSTLKNAWDALTGERPQHNGISLTEGEQQQKAPPIFPTKN